MNLGLLGTLVVVFVVLLVLAAMGLRGLRPAERRQELSSVIDRYGPLASDPRHAAPASAVSRAVMGVASRMLRSSNSETRLARRLDQAGITRKPAEWALLAGCSGLAVAAVISLLTGDGPLGVVAGLGLGWLGARVLVDFRIGRRRSAFSDQLPNVLQLVAGSLQTGFSLAQALDAVVREETQPASAEFARALAEARLGVDLADALESVADRLGSADLRWTVMAIRIQREVGGNLAEVLRNTVGTMRERAYLRRQVRALSAEGRLSAYILVALPILAGVWLTLSSPVYMRPLYTTLGGITMLLVAILLVVVGSLWMRRLIKVEV